MESAFRDKVAEARLFQSRAWVMGIFIFLLICVLISRLVFLQIISYEKYKIDSENNRIGLRPEAPTRGLIFDRNGVLLAENVPSFSLTITKERVTDLDKTLEELGQIVELSEREIERFHKRLKERRRPYQSIALKVMLSEEDIARLSVNRFYLPGVNVEAKLVRHYPHGEAFAHVLGYVGRINQKEAQTLDEARYRATDIIGKIGVEKFYESELHGEVGYQKVETNARGRILQVLERQDPTPGNDLTLTLDYNLQAKAAEQMEGRRGAVVAIDIETGGILALYSNPSFDANLFVQGISHKNYQSLRNNPDLPLFNRATRGQYPPGSTMKPFIGLSFLEAGTVDWKYSIKDVGWYKLENDERYYRDWKRKGHGHKVDMHQAMVESCDVYFYDGAFRTGVNTMSPFLAQFGFGQNLVVDISDARKGLLPTKAWKKKKTKRSWYAGDSLNFGIGQGFMLATPMQLATATAVLAAKGKWHTPHLLKATTDSDQQTIVNEFTPPMPDVELSDPKDWDLMFDAMKDVIFSYNGTARSLAKGLNFTMAGKTGTAQVVSIKQNEEYDSEALDERNRDHALFVAFAPVEAPKIAIAVIVENGESAGGTAGPVAKQVIQEYLQGLEGVQG